MSQPDPDEIMTRQCFDILVQTVNLLEEPEERMHFRVLIVQGLQAVNQAVAEYVQNKVVMRIIQRDMQNKNPN